MGDKHHYVYKLTALNPVDARKYYIGVRSSDCLPEEDVAYFGSSKHVDAAIASGVIFEKTILATGYDRHQVGGIEEALHNFHNVSNNPAFFNVARAGTHYSRLGRPHTEETKNKLSKILKNRVISEESKKRMSISRMGNKYNLGKSASEQTKSKMSLSAKAFSNTEKGKALRSMAGKLSVIARAEKRNHAP